MEKIGKQSIRFDNSPSIISTACIVGPKESNGPLAKYFDKTDKVWDIISHLVGFKNLCYFIS